MKRFLKSKLFLSLAAFVLIASAIAVPFTGNIVHSHAQASAGVTPNPTQEQEGTLPPASPSNSSRVASSDPSGSVLVPATAQWVNTGITLSVGDTLTVSATGSWSADPSDGFTGPDGYTKAWPDNFLNLQDIGSCAFCATTLTPNWGALIGYIGDNPPVAGSYTSTSILPEAQKVFVVGSSFNNAVTSAGTLWLNFNDDAYSNFTSDNAGQVTATVTVSAPMPHRQLIIFLQGITTSLNSNQANNGVIVGMRNVPDTIKTVFPAASTKPDAATRLLEYSYFASRTDNGLPSAYNCVDTITNPLFGDILLLDKQIKNAFKVEPPGADVDIYLIGHSLGGVVALGYQEFLEQGGLFVSLPPGAQLKAVITLDSPIGGVAKGFLTDFSVLGGQILEQRCPAVEGQPLTAPKELETIFASSSTTAPPEPEDSGTNPQGAQASILAEAANFVTTLPNPLPSNENLAEGEDFHHHRHHPGISFLSIGNLNDFLFDPHACAGALPSFLDTMFLEDDGDGNGLYGRYFVSVPGTCPGIYNIKQATQIVIANHFAVLSDGNVQLGIQNFLTPLASGNVGGTPSPLPVNPFQSPDS